MGFCGFFPLFFFKQEMKVCLAARKQQQKKKGGGRESSSVVTPRVDFYDWLSVCTVMQAFVPLFFFPPYFCFFFLFHYVTSLNAQTGDPCAFHLRIRTIHSQTSIKKKKNTYTNLSAKDSWLCAWCPLLAPLSQIVYMRLCYFSFFLFSACSQCFFFSHVLGVVSCFI